ncbi:MAE_28990/MAE_18760 family HEPN-like nuclease [Bacillus cereus group sp. Bc177]|uniref:MAE_28990/MAE_18760 family HEPN-like nuclease n=2 Tax=Bacillus cereus group TaxID=86661 RepID=UPI0022E69D5A|nr:MAE_28990/MAE_18760 family HEPN-like nuclease [Bacillus cereus group sp. Bc177]MDA2322658.1 MAE_28990/MAE_18760 family HEPN-like nuclease [Bacillus cereus group sp. Bc177]
MKIRDLENLEERIDKDFSWRKMELLQLKMAIEKNNVALSKKTLVRSGIALLCAHWEGFIRSVANYYVVYICGQKVKHKDLKGNFLAFKVKKDVILSGNSPKNSVHTQFLSKLEILQEEVFYIKYDDKPFKRIINTDSNLSFELFDEILKSIGLQNIYETKKNYIDNEMLKYRHEIVHGESYKDTEYNFTEVYDQVLSIMESFKNQVIEAAEEKEYLKV